MLVCKSLLISHDLHCNFIFLYYYVVSKGSDNENIDKK